MNKINFIDYFKWFNNKHLMPCRLYYQQNATTVALQGVISTLKSVDARRYFNIYNILINDWRKK